MSHPTPVSDGEDDVSSTDDTGLPPASRNVRLTLAYDGTAYRGWQVQPNGLSVQECVEAAVRQLTGESRRVLCAGRTDAGVHALGQVANFYTNSLIPIENFRRGLQNFLPHDITVVNAAEVPLSFHATYSAIRKRYRYVLHDGEICPPFLDKYVFRSRFPLNTDHMAQGAQCLLGRHDFRCFETAYPNKATSVRTVSEVSVVRFSSWQPWTAAHDWIPNSDRARCRADQPFILFEIVADGFLYNMVRAIVGTLGEIGRGKRAAGAIREIIDSQDRRLAGTTAPACGLYLVGVDYPDDPHG